MDERTSNKNMDSCIMDTQESSEDEGEEITYFEESSESEPEFECETWDDCCQILPRIEGIQTFTGRHLVPTCDNEQFVSVEKKIKLCFTLNPKLLTNDLQNIWKANLPTSTENLEVITDPFKICVVKDLLENAALLDRLRQELYSINFNLRSMDLYEFFQSKDLKHLLDSDCIKMLYDFLNTDLMNWVANVTGYNLTHISATCSLYSNTDYLLVHDDQRDDRRVAFILYLTDDSPWNIKDGGALQLLSKDKFGQPLEVVKDVLPSNNQFVFFPVASDSYHQVAEVTNLNKYRLSINGWFHTKVPPVFEIPTYKPQKNSLYSQDYLSPQLTDIDLETWIREDYLDRDTIQLIQKHIEQDSEICLKNYLRQEALNEILLDLQFQDLQWKKAYPVNRYSYEIADPLTVSYTLGRFLLLFQSVEMFKLLQSYTELDLDSKTARMKFELQRWTPESYALLTEYDWKAKNELDLIICFGCKNSSDVIGARTQYVVIEDEIQNALITIEPEENNMNIVYRDSARFTKYFSKQSRCQCFYMLICSYSE